ncbi:hypothetical protein BDN70DRAFT_658708 [Pholiota conissans]|uniref:Uncharacterized protein n=1 Tax=Pholiota conissans TaxID=109636 RepID=A0A9P5Z477_9AGAR|nr:hypothetical protein BDN70DRAFT_658708 [Pholiota conissans]
MFKSSPIWTLLIPLFLFVIGALAGPCMPCQNPNKRSTPWDHRFSVRGLHTPKITTPTSGTVWTKDSDALVTWDNHNMTSSDAKGTLFLGYLENGKDDQHLDVDRPLAKDFPLSTGFVTFQCPEVASRNDYIVVLLSGSGSRSSPFTIKP